MSDFNLILLEPLLIVAGLVVFAVWQFRDLRRAREQTRRAREAQASEAPDRRESADPGDRG
ncbi:MAG: hypothetical protein EBS99_07935 [Betaproteobacteria bacterium]|nr:hypothetical protein [Betaproteobacteria bacterium]